MYGRIENGFVHDHQNKRTDWKVQGNPIEVYVWLYSEVESSAKLYLTRHETSGMWGVWENDFEGGWNNVSFVRGNMDEQQIKAFLWDRLQYLQRRVPEVAKMLHDEVNRCNKEIDDALANLSNQIGEALGEANP